MWDRLTRVTAPATQPVTVAEAKAQMRVDGTDEDIYIGNLIDRATRRIDGPHGVGICLVSQQWRLALDTFPAKIRIPLGPVISVDALAYTATDGTAATLTDGTDYRVANLGDLVLVEPVYGGSWPSVQPVSGAVTVTFTAGHASVPEDLKHAVIMLVTHWFENRVSVTEDGGEELPFGVSAILNDYRVGTAA